MKIVEETPHHVTLQHPEGHVVRIAKAALSKKTLDKLKGFARGGEVEKEMKVDTTVPYQTGETPSEVLPGFKRMDPDKVGAFTEGFTGQPAVAKKEKVQKFDDGGPVLQQDPPPPEGNPNTEVATAPLPAPSFLDSLKEGVSNLGHMLATGRSGDAPQATAAPQAAAPVQKELPQNAPLAMPASAQQQGSQYFPDFTKPYKEAAADIIGGQTQAAKLETAAGVQQASALTSEVQKLQNLQDWAKKHYDDLETQRQAMVKDVQDNKINPNRYTQDLGTFGRIRTALGLMISGAGSGLAHQQNAAMDYLNKQIDRDIDAQKRNLGSSETLLSENLRQYGNLKDAEQATRVGLLSMAEGELNKVAALNKGPLAMAAVQQAKGQLGMQMAPQLTDLSMKRAVYSQLGQGASGGGFDPALAVRFVVPEKEQPEAFKEMASLQAMKKGGENILNAFNKVNQMTLGGTFSPNQKSALIEPVIAQLSKETAGRFTEQDAHMIRALMPSSTDIGNTRMVKRQQLINFVTEKMNSPLLRSYGLPIPQISSGVRADASPGYLQAGQQGQPQGQVRPVSNK